MGMMLLIGKSRSFKIWKLKGAKYNKNKNERQSTKPTGWWMLFKFLPSVWATLEWSLPVTLNLPGTDLSVHLIAARSSNFSRKHFALWSPAWTRKPFRDDTNNFREWHGNNGRDPHPTPGQDLSAWHGQLGISDQRSCNLLCFLLAEVRGGERIQIQCPPWCWVSPGPNACWHTWARFLVSSKTSQ